MGGDRARERPGNRPVLRVLVVEDEEPARETLRTLVEEDPGLEWVGESWGERSPEAIRRTRPDLVLLDVRMPGMDGFEVLRSLGTDPDPAVIFVTAYDDRAVEAFEVRALDYLLKPFTDERFRRAVARARDRLARSELAPPLADGEIGTGIVGEQRLLLREGGRILILRLARITWIEASGHYVVVHLSDGREHLVRTRLKEMVRILGRRGFYRIHRSALVNLEAVREIRGLSHGDAMVRLADGPELRLSRGRRSGLEAALTTPKGTGT